MTTAGLVYSVNDSRKEILLAPSINISANKNKRRLSQRRQENARVDYNDATITVLSLDTSDAVYEIHDRSLLNNTYVELTLFFRLEKVGESYYISSDRTLGLESPEELLKKDVSEIVNVSLVTGRFYEVLGEYDTIRRISGVSVVGGEEDVFLPIVAKNDEEDYYYSDYNYTMRHTYEVKPIHSLRVSGVLLFAISTFLTALLYTSGRRRYLMRKAMKKRMKEKSETIGLSSEDAVTKMLNVGRKKAAIAKKTNYNGKLPTTRQSSWEVTIGRENVVIT